MQPRIIEAKAIVRDGLTTNERFLRIVTSEGEEVTGVLILDNGGSDWDGPELPDGDFEALAILSGEVKDSGFEIWE